MNATKGRQWSLKLVAFFLAVLLWAYVSNEINPTTQQIINRVPLEARSLPGNVSVVEMPGTIDLRIQGPREKVQQVGVRAVEAYVNLARAKIGKTRVPIQVKVPEGITVIEVNPREVEVWIENISEKQVPLSMQKTGEQAKGYKVLEPIFEPSRVILKGPESLLERIDRGFVKVNFNGTTEGFHGMLPVQVADAKGNPVNENLVGIHPEQVDVFVPVVLDLPSKVVPIKPVIEGRPAEGYVVSDVIPELATVSVFGQADLVNDINEVNTAPINIEGATADVYQEASFVMPEGIQSGTASIKVLVKVIPEKE